MSTLPDTKKDYTDELQIIIPESSKIAETISLEEAINVLLGLERKCRTNNDFSNLKEVCLHMVRLCKQKSDWAKLNSTLVVLNKRRAQSKMAITAIVMEALTYVDSTPSKEIKVDLIKTLMEICEGKIYVEAECARLHLMLALMLEEDGDLTGACDNIQDVHVETYGSLSKKEKAEYILQQVRLNLLRKDYIRALIQCRKMNRKTIEEEGFEDVKVKFYTMMVEYHVQEKDSWEICQSYFKIFDTSVTKADPVAKLEALRAAVLFALLSGHDNHQKDMLHRLLLLPDVQAQEALLSALTQFTTAEIIPFPFPFMDALTATTALTSLPPDVLDHFTAKLRVRVNQHNIRTVSAYYARIRIARLATLLGLDEETTETQLSEMVAAGDICLRIDRPAGIVTFGQAKKAEEVLSSWASDVGRMLHLMESTCHLINRENMVHKI